MSAQLDTDAKDDVVLVRNGGAVIAVRQGGDSLGLTDTMAPPRREASPSAGLAKRTAPSPVVFFWSLPPSVEESDVFPLCAAFGPVVKILILRMKHQALVEMATVDAADAVVQYYRANPLVLRGHAVSIDFSTHEHVEIKPSRSSASSSAAGAATGAASGAGTDRPDAGAAAEHSAPSPVLHIRVSEYMYPITVETLQTALQPYGALLRVILFLKAHQLMALVEFDSVASASAAKSAVDGQYLYSGCNLLHVTFSKMTHLVVKHNSDKSRDFTLPAAPPAVSSAAMGDGRGAHLPLTHMPFGAAMAPLPGNPPLPAAGHGPMSIATMMPTPTMGSAGAAMSPYHPAAAATSPVIIIGGFEADKVSPYHLFILCGVYGDVLRVKKLFKKQDEALVQFRTPEQASIARTHLNGASLFGHALRVNASQKFTVSLKADESGLSQDFSNSQLHRYRTARHMKHICSPSRVLHVANIPVDLSDDAVTKLFANHGTVSGVKALAPTADTPHTKMLLVGLETVDEATAALVHLHNHKIGDRYLRISFTRSAL